MSRLGPLIGAATHPPTDPILSCMHRSSRQSYVVYFIPVTKRNCRADTLTTPLARAAYSPMFDTRPHPLFVTPTLLPMPAHRPFVSPLSRWI